MSHARVLFCVLSLVAAASVVAAEDPGSSGRRWVVDADAVFSQIRSYDQDVGTVIVRDESGPFALQSEKPVFSEFDSDLLVRVGLERKLARWSWAVTGWTYDGADGSRDVVLSSDAAAGITAGVTTVALIPEATAPDVTDGELKLRATNHFQAWALDAAALYPMVRGESGELRLSAGVRVTDFRDERVESLVILDGGTHTRYAHVAHSRSSALVGPLFAISGTVRTGRHRFEGSFAQAIVMGAVDRDAQWVNDIDDVPQAESKFDDGRDLSLPLTELRLRWTYAVAPAFSIGAGFFATIWWDAPVAPLGSTPVGPASAREQTFSIAGLMATATWRSGAH